MYISSVRFKRTVPLGSLPWELTHATMSVYVEPSTLYYNSVATHYMIGVASADRTRQKRVTMA